MKSIVSLSLTCLGLVSLGCPSESPQQLEISSAQAALSAADNSERALAGILRASDFVAGSTRLSTALGLVAQTAADCAGAALCEAAEGCPATDTDCSSGDRGALVLEDARLDLHERVEALVRLLRERILIEANLEVSTATSSTYLLGPDVLCTETSADSTALTASASSSAEIDPDCVSRVERLHPRLRLTSPREADIDMTLLLGEDKHAPLTFQLYKKSLGLQLNLREALSAARDLGKGLEGLEELSGVLQVQLLENQENDYSIAVNVLEALHIVTDMDGKRVSASLRARSPALSLRVDGNARRLTAGVDLGAFELHGPLRWLSSMLQETRADDQDSRSDAESTTEQRDSGDMDLFLGGLSASFSYVADSDVLNIDNIGLGVSTSSLKHEGNTLLAVDLNAEHGRRVNVKLEPLGDATKISISPTLDLGLSLAFRHVQRQLDNISPALLADTLRIWFAGDAPTLEVSDEQVRVASGSLHLDSSADPSANINVTAGMCLSEAAEPGQTHGFFAGLAANRCQ
jgi:hypothetical protein